MTRYPYDDPERRPPYGEDSEWGYDNLFCIWVYVGDDEELQRRWNEEMDLVEAYEWDNERPLEPPALNRAPIVQPPYDRRYERPAQWTVWIVAGVCVVIALVLLTI